jgi:GAF domain-containing protein
MNQKTLEPYEREFLKILARQAKRRLEQKAAEQKLKKQA